MYKLVLVLLAPLVFSGCLPTWQSTSNASGEWVVYTTFVDGIMEVKVSLPPLDQPLRTPTKHLISTKANEPINIVSQGYNTGLGKYRGLNFIHFNGVIIRIESDKVGGEGVGIEDIKRELYLTRPDRTGDYEFVELVNYNDKDWLRVNLVGENNRRGVSYVRPIYGNYALLLSFTMFGERSDETELFKERSEDLKKVLQSVQVTVEDFELNRANP